MFVVVAVVAALDPLGVGGKIETDLGILCGFSLAEGLCRFDLIGWFFFFLIIIIISKVTNILLMSIYLASVNRLILPYLYQ